MSIALFQRGEGGNAFKRSELAVEIESVVVDERFEEEMR